MPGLNFSGANLATVAYANVDGAAGASTVTNSGITTTRTALGTYVVILPTNLTQTAGRDLIVVTPKAPAGAPVAVMFTVDDALDATKTISFFDGNPANGATTKLDSSFSILILRTTIAPPSGAPA
jgi:hypothetical protein